MAETSLIDGGERLLFEINNMKENTDILGRKTNRLSQLKHLIDLSILDKELRYAEKL